MSLEPSGGLQMVRLLAVGVLLLLAPGCVLQSLLLRGERFPVGARIPISFVFSVAFITALGGAAYVLHGTLASVQVAFFVALVALLLVWALAHGRGVRVPRVRMRVGSRRFWLGVIVILVALGCAALAWYGKVWLSQRSDGFYHLAAIRREIQVGSVFPRDVFYSQDTARLNVTTGSWHLVLALFSVLSRVDITFIWVHLPVLMAPLLALSFYAFAETLLRSPWLALFCTIIELVLYDKLDFRSSMYPNQAGFIVLWIAFVLAWRYLDSGRRTELALTLALAVVLVSWHLVLAVLLFAGLGAYLVFRVLALLVSRSGLKADVETRRLLYLLLPMVLIALPFAALRASQAHLLSLGQLFAAIPDPDTRSTLSLGHGLAIVSPFQFYTVDPRWRFAPGRFALWAIAFLAVPFLIPASLKRRRWALFMSATAAVVPLILCNPLIIAYLRGRVPHYSMLRLLLLPPYSLLVGWFFWAGIHRFNQRLRRLPRLRLWPSSGAWKAALGLVAGGVVVTLMGVILIRQGIDNLSDLYDPASSHPYSLAVSRAELHLSTQAPYRFLLEHTVPRAVVASDPESSYYLAALTGRAVIAVPAGHDPPTVPPSHTQRRRHSAIITNPASDLQETTHYLDFYTACLVWVDNRIASPDPTEVRLKFDSYPDLFQQVYRDSDVTIYSYRAAATQCVAP